MKKALIIALALVAGFLFVVPNAQAEGIGFNMGTLMFDSGESTATNGGGSFFSFNFAIDENASAGFYHEGMSLKLKDDQLAAAIGSTVNVDINISAIEACRKVSSKPNVWVGVHAGVADLSGTMAGALTFVDTVPTADVFVKWEAISGGKKIQTSVAAVVGYRYLTIDSIYPDLLAGAGDFVDTVDSLSGVFVGVAVGVNF